MKKEHILLFDIDGTLLMTGGAGKIAIERAFMECFGIPDTWGNIQPDGKTDPAIFQEMAIAALGRALEGEELKRISDLYLRYFAGELPSSDRFRILPGIPELLQALSLREDLHLGIATGNFRESAYAKLKHGALDHYFEFGGFGCDSENRPRIVAAAIERAKNRLEERRVSQRGHVIVIGDTPLDIHAGKENGALTVAVCTGKYSEKELKSFSPDCVVTDFSVPTLFLKMID